MYEVTVGTDGLGGLYERRPVRLCTDDLAAAMAEAERLRKFAACVHRTCDGAVLAPNGRWVNAEGEEIG